MDSLLSATVPSYNVSQEPISDEATFVRPATLRGLPPDSTLVLVNGKRRHRGSVINFLGAPNSRGSQGADISNIPSIALERVEVLRDGAAAQYGSDAIAGVLNFSAQGGHRGSDRADELRPELPWRRRQSERGRQPRGAADREMASPTSASSSITWTKPAVAYSAATHGV